MTADADKPEVGNRRIRKHSAAQRKVVDETASEAMSSEMRELILRFDAKTSSKRPRVRDARGRFVSSRASGG